MTIGEVGAIGELVGGLGVLATLIYLAAQVNQSNRLASAQVHQETSRISSEFGMQMTREEMELAAKVTTGWEELSMMDRQLIGVRLSAVVNYYETLYYAHERGDVEDDLWASRIERMRRTFVLFAPMWPEYRGTFGGRFGAFVDREVLPQLDQAYWERAAATSQAAQ